MIDSTPRDQGLLDMSDELRKRIAGEANVQTETVDAVIDAYRSGIDHTLIRRNLGLSVEERFEQLMSLQKLADELRAAGKRTSNDD